MVSNSTRIAQLARCPEQRHLMGESSTSRFIGPNISWVPLRGGHRNRMTARVRRRGASWAWRRLGLRALLKRQKPIAVPSRVMAMRPWRKQSHCLTRPAHDFVDGVHGGRRRHARSLELPATSALSASRCPSLGWRRNRGSPVHSPWVARAMVSKSAIGASTDQRTEVGRPQSPPDRAAAGRDARG